MNDPSAHGVDDRVVRALDGTSPLRAALGIGLVVALGLALLAVQGPLVHDASHNFRHATGITCH